MRETVECFFCARSLAAHANNRQRHVWRLGPWVERDDFELNDEATKAIHRRDQENQWRLREERLRAHNSGCKPDV